MAKPPDPTTSCLSDPIPLPYLSIQEYVSKFRPRINKYAERADEGAWAFREDFQACGSNIHRVGSIDLLSGNFAALTVPDALPDRIFVIGYLAEAAFVFDDMLDLTDLSNEESQTSIQTCQDNTNVWASLSTSDTSGGSRFDNVKQKNVCARMKFELLKADGTLGAEVWKAWEDKQSTNRIVKQTSRAAPKSVEEFLVWRVEDAQLDMWMAVHRFGIRFTLSQEEKQSVAHITHTMYAAMALVNDYYSWDVEYSNYLRQDKPLPMVNSVHMIMQWHSVSANGAKKLLKWKIRSLEKKYCSMKDKFLAGPNSTTTLSKWFRILELCHAGMTLWSTTTARYNASAPLPLTQPISGGGGFLGRAGTGDTTATATDEKRTIFSQEEHNSLIPKNEHCMCCKTTLDEKIILEPFDFLSSLPSKGVRNAAISSLNLWYNLPQDQAQVVQEIVDLLHQSSLMIDDIEDGSTLRRGYPAVHTIYGLGQTINAANYILARAMDLTCTFADGAIKPFLDELRQIAIGQGNDLHWTYQCKAPTESEYMDMVKRKTGGVFRVLSKLMRYGAKINRELNTDQFMTLLGQYFQIRDDYCNLTSTEYTATKGWCEDLDEGKFSILLIHALKHSTSTQLLSILQGRKLNKGMTVEMKKLVLKHMEEAGTFDYTRGLLQDLHVKLNACIEGLEQQAGERNWILRLLLQRLEI